MTNDDFLDLLRDNQSFNISDENIMEPDTTAPNASAHANLAGPQENGHTESFMQSPFHQPLDSDVSDPSLHPLTNEIMSLVRNAFIEQFATAIADLLVSHDLSTTCAEIFRIVLDRFQPRFLLVFRDYLATMCPDAESGKPGESDTLNANNQSR